MTRCRIFFILILFAIIGCQPKVTYKLVRDDIKTLDYDANQIVISVDENVSDSAIYLGKLKAKGRSNSKICLLASVLDFSELESRKVGANVLQLVETNKPPDASSCYQLEYKMYRVSPIEVDALAEEFQKKYLDPKAETKIVAFRPSKYGLALVYKLRLDDEVLGPIYPGDYSEFDLSGKDGKVVWAKTEAREELSFSKKEGYNHYLRCGVTLGAFVGRPSLQWVSARQAALELNLLKE